MKTTHRILSALVLVMILASSVSCCYAQTLSNPPPSDKAPTIEPSSVNPILTSLFKKEEKKQNHQADKKKQPVAKNQGKEAQTTEQKDLLTRLVENGILPQTTVNAVKNYVQENTKKTATSDKVKKADYLNDNAALKKLYELTMDKKIKERVCKSLSDTLWKAYTEAHKRKDYEEPFDTKLTQTMLKALVQANILNEEDMGKIVFQQCRDILETCFQNKGISQQDYDAVIQEIDKVSPIEIKNAG